ncbi:MAG: DUF4186 domain-containing protein [Candidatus Marinimicrobia bacterium]|nr:DUF4186 domain-containing protein [Candidatus Neomarinimicrobiota bacterium]MCF7827549.1 DUF4186 domain-containing protein [Candidatus Neomarinimicrobiota bacterium]MCF7881589.1 DUF4186 domain-containing protein [Candidatus Neomarinimicrobiota bacterium]
MTDFTEITKDKRTQQVNDVLERLNQSPFRRRFKLKGPERDYLRKKKMNTIMKHAAEFIENRVAPANPSKDGKQTPMKNHPVFIAQHATATCCRGCLEKWHGIERGHRLNSEEIGYILTMIRIWLERNR